jgi:hypothetical protein
MLYVVRTCKSLYNRLRVREHHTTITSSSCREFSTSLVPYLLLHLYHGRIRNVDEDDGGPLTPRTKAIMQHFQKQVREYTDGIDNDLQVVNEKLGQMEATQIANNTRLAGLEATVGRMDKSLVALLRCFDGSTRR